MDRNNMTREAAATLGGALTSAAGPRLTQLALQAARSVADLVWPVLCVGCGAPSVSLCRECLARLPAAAVTRQLGGTGGHSGSDHSVQVSARARYVSPLPEAIVAFKDHGRLGLGPDLAEMLVASVEHSLRGSTLTAPPILVPAPSSRAATRTRGRFPMGELAQRAARIGGWQYVNALCLTRATKDQVGLNERERERNLRGAVAVRPSVAGGLGTHATVVLVDDVVTSGATLLDARRALRHSGIAPRLAVIADAVRPRASGVSEADIKS